MAGLQTRARLEVAGNTAAGHGTAYDYKYKADFIDTIGNYLVWSAFAQMEVNEEGWGDEQKLHRLSPLTAATTEATEGTPLAYSEGADIVKSVVTLTMTQHHNAVFISDRLEFEDQDNNTEMAVGLLTEWAGNVVDLLARGYVTGGTVNWYASDSVGGYSTTITDCVGTVNFPLFEKMIRYADLVKMRPWIESVPANPNFNTTGIPKGIPVICSPYQKADIRKLWGTGTLLDLVQHYPREDRIHPSEFAAYDCLRFCYADQYKETAGGGGTAGAGIKKTGAAVDIHSMVMIGKGAYGSSKILGFDQQQTKEAPFEIIRKQLGSAGTADATNQVASVGVKFYYTGGVLIDEHILEVGTAVYA